MRMLRATYHGTATVQLSLPDGTTLLTDPAFDPAGVDYGMAHQGMTRMVDAFPPPPVNDVDVVLLSHQDHPDNFDCSGRAFAAQVGRIVGTKDVVKLGPDAVPLAAWESYAIGSADDRVTITAVPARHGPVELLPFVGDVTGFVVEGGGLQGALYISGDTVYAEELNEIGERFDVRTAILHLGAVKLPALGDSPLTLCADEGARLARRLGVRTVVPVHYEGWGHFTQGRSDVERAFGELADGPSPVWLQPGVPTVLGGWQ